MERDEKKTQTLKLHINHNLALTKRWKGKPDEKKVDHCKPQHPQKHVNYFTPRAADSTKMRSYTRDTQTLKSTYTSIKKANASLIINQSVNT